MGTKAGWYLENVVEWACEYVRLDVLEWFKNSKQWVDPDDGWVGQVEYVDGTKEPRYPPEGKPDHFAMDAASMQGKLKVLDWIADNAPVVPLLYTRMAIESACASGNLDVLKWWHSRGMSAGLEPRYTEQALYCATVHGHLHVLEWWTKESRWELRYDLSDLFRHALRAPDFDAMVEWWITESGLPAIDFATQCKGVVTRCDSAYSDRTLDNLAVLDNWTRSKHRHLFPCSVSDALCSAARAGQIRVLNWWKNKSALGIVPALEFGHGLMDAATSGEAKDANGCVCGSSDRLGTVKWVYDLHAEYSIGVQYSATALDDIQWDCVADDSDWANAIMISVLKWWLASGLDLRYSERAFVNAVLVVSREDADWWVRESGLPMRYTADGVRRTLELKHVCPERVDKLVKWMMANGLDLRLSEDECKGDDGRIVMPVLEEYFSTLTVSI